MWDILSLIYRQEHFIPNGFHHPTRAHTPPIQLPISHPFKSMSPHEVKSYLTWVRRDSPNLIELAQGIHSKDNVGHTQSDKRGTDRNHTRTKKTLMERLVPLSDLPTLPPYAHQVKLQQGGPLSEWI